MTDKSKHDVAADLAYFQAEAELAAHRDTMSNYYDTRQQPDGLWYIVGSMDGENWYYVYEQLFSFPTQNEARAWLIAEGYTHREIGERIRKAVVVQHIEDVFRVTSKMLGELRDKR